MRKIIWIATGVVVLLALAAGAYWFVGHNPFVGEPEVPGLRPQLANPASVFCGTLGGTVTIKNNAQGEVGICALPDGRQCEEWALFQKNECLEG